MAASPAVWWRKKWGDRLESDVSLLIPPMAFTSENASSFPPWLHFPIPTESFPFKDNCFTWNQKVKHCVYTASYWVDQWDRLTCRFWDALNTQVSARQVLSVHQYVVLTGMLVYSGKKIIVKTEYWTLPNRSIVDCTQRYSSLETYAGWEYTHPAHVATSGGAVGIRLLPWIPENSFFQRQKQHIHSYHHISGKNVTFSSTVNKSSNSLSTYKLKKACTFTCEIC